MNAWLRRFFGRRQTRVFDRARQEHAPMVDPVWSLHQVWIEEHVRPPTAVFNPSLAPRGGSAYEIICQTARDKGDWTQYDFAAELSAAVDEVIRLRAALMGDTPMNGGSSRAPQGRWIWFFPDSAEFSQLAIGDVPEVDEADAPAWDFWVAAGYLQGSGVPDRVVGKFCILSWIPEARCRRFDTATKLSVLDALTWSTCVPPNFYLENR